MKTLDAIFDMTLYALALICFVTAGALIIQTAIVGDNLLIHAGGLILMGIVASSFMIHLKQRSPKDKGTSD